MTKTIDFLKVISDRTILSVPSKDADKDDIDYITDRMVNLMEENQGWQGLSAIQLGVPTRIMAVRIGGKIVVMCNPTIKYQHGCRYSVEGCLSVPYRYMVKRPTYMYITYVDRHGYLVERFLNKSEARVFMHEYDHLQGLLLSSPGRFRLRLMRNEFYKGE